MPHSRREDRRPPAAHRRPRRARHQPLVELEPGGARAASASIDDAALAPDPPQPDRAALRGWIRPGSTACAERPATSCRRYDRGHGVDGARDREHERHLVRPDATPSSHGRPVAYFCAEFGLHNSVPIYSGGLGVLAGDHCKAASDLGVPLVGVGLFYTKGYFDQRLRLDGWQEDSDDEFDPVLTPLVPSAGPQTASRGSRWSSTFGRPVHVRAWTHDGRPGAGLPARHQPRGEPPRRPRRC